MQSILNDLKYNNGHLFSCALLSKPRRNLPRTRWESVTHDKAVDVVGSSSNMLLARRSVPVSRERDRRQGIGCRSSRFLRLARCVRDDANDGRPTLVVPLVVRICRRLDYY